MKKETGFSIFSFLHLLFINLWTVSYAVEADGGDTEIPDDLSDDSFEDEFAEEVAAEAPKAPKEIKMLVEDQIKEGSTFKAYQEMIKQHYGSWDSMNNPAKNAVNKIFKKAGVFGAGGGKQQVARSKAQARYIELKKQITKTMYDAGAALGAELDELQTLSDAKDKAGKPVLVSFEIYCKGDKKFFAGIPDED